MDDNYDMQADINAEQDAKAQYEAECDAAGRAEAECQAQEQEALDMDTKSLREILNSMMCADCECLYESDIKLRVDQALKEIQELCEPMSEDEIAKSIYEHCNVHGYNMMKIEHRQFLAKALVGKLSTPRLMEECPEDIVAIEFNKNNIAHEIYDADYETLGTEEVKLVDRTCIKRFGTGKKPSVREE